MSWKDTSDTKNPSDNSNGERQRVGVIGAGSFGTAIANLLAENQEVLLYVRNPKSYERIKETRKNKMHNLHNRVIPINNLEQFCKECTLIFPIVDSPNFRTMCQDMNPFLKPHHILIHGTKGLNVVLPESFDEANPKLSKQDIHTMTEVIQQETLVLRVGCLSGPNLAGELSENKPGATVVASRFDEVIEAGKLAIRNPRFRVYGSHDVLGVEIAGVLKNVMAIASGILNGMDLGYNAKALLLTRGLGEMVKLGRALGSNTDAFFGIAGVGDLIATCSSPGSRNYTVGYRLAKGEKLDFILEDMNDTAEGIYTARLAFALCNHFNISAPIIESVYKILYEDIDILDGMQYLMTHEFDSDADYISA